MNKCRNPAFNEIECPYALSGIGTPCCGKADECSAWRERFEKGVIIEVFEEKKCQEKKNTI